jgi:hypothetical protein
MRAFGTLLWFVVLGFCVYNWWQIRALQGELEEQRRATVRVSERSPGLLRKLEVALQRGERARALLEQGKHREARKELDRAVEEFSDATRSADEATKERLKSVEDSFSRFREQTQGLLRKVTASDENRSKGD